MVRHTDTRSRDRRTGPIVLVLLLIVAGFGAGLSAPAAAEPPVRAARLQADETREQRSDQDVKDEFREACERSGGLYVDWSDIDDTVLCAMPGYIVECVVWVASVYGFDVGCYIVHGKPAVPDETIRGADPQEVAPVQATSEPEFDPGRTEIVAESDIGGEAALPDQDSAEFVLQKPATQTSLTEDTFSTACRKVGGSYDRTPDGKWQCTLPSGTVVECDPIKVDLLGGWKGCEIVETAVVQPGVVDRPAGDQVVQADPVPTATATAANVVEVDQAQPAGEEVVESGSDPTAIPTEAPVPTETPAPTEAPDADTTAPGAITDRPAGDQVVQPEPQPTATPTPTPTPFVVE